MRIRTQCRECGLPFRAELRPESAELPCPNCGRARPVAQAGEIRASSWSDRTTEAYAVIEVCPLCDCRHLYRQRDVNRALGCAIVAVGAALVPWTFGLSLLAFGLVDLWLYRRLQEVVVCYRCDTVYRDARPLPRQTAFDLLKHDVLKYGKSWDDEKVGEGPTAGSS